MDEKLIKSKIASGYIYVRSIIEVLGKPKEHVEETLKAHVKKISEDKDYNIIKKTVEKAERQEDFFNAFAEIEFLVKDTLTLLSFCFDYMPSSVEIIEPEQIMIKNSDFTGFINDMQARLHALNTGVIETNERSNFYVRNTAVMLRNFLVVLLSSKPMTTTQMKPYIGISEVDIKKVLDVLLKEGKVKKQNELYSVVPK